MRIHVMVLYYRYNGRFIRKILPVSKNRLAINFLLIRRWDLILATASQNSVSFSRSELATSMHKLLPIRISRIERNFKTGIADKKSHSLTAFLYEYTVYTSTYGRVCTVPPLRIIASSGWLNTTNSREQMIVRLRLIQVKHWKFCELNQILCIVLILSFEEPRYTQFFDI